MEPTFSRTMLVWPLAGTGMVAPEDEGPALAIPHGALLVSLRDMDEQNLTADIGAEPLAGEPENTAAPQAAKSLRKWPIAIVVSCLLHAAAAAALLASGLFSPSGEMQQLEGADQPGMMLVGNATDDQSMAGDVTNITLVATPEPVETVQEQPIVADEAPQRIDPPATVAPVSKTPAPEPQPVHEPVVTEPAQPEDPAPVEVTNPFPEILSVAPQVLDDVSDAVQKAVQADTVEAAQKAEAAKTQPIKPEAAPTPKTVEAVPEPRPVEQKNPATKTKPVKQAEPKPKKPAQKKTSSGAGGANQADSKQGVANGVTKGQSTIASKGGVKSAIGNAAVSNYPGKVAAKLRRVSRGLSRSAQSGASNNAQVAFVVTSDGGIDALRLVKSSGSPELDKAALAIVQRAAPFPPIPPEAQRSSWAFALPIGPF